MERHFPNEVIPILQVSYFMSWTTTFITRTNLCSGLWHDTLIFHTRFPDARSWKIEAEDWRSWDEFQHTDTGHGSSKLRILSKHKTHVKNSPNNTNYLMLLWTLLFCFETPHDLVEDHNLIKQAQWPVFCLCAPCMEHIVPAWGTMAFLCPMHGTQWNKKVPLLKLVWLFFWSKLLSCFSMILYIKGCFVVQPILSTKVKRAVAKKWKMCHCASSTTETQPEWGQRGPAPPEKTC